MLAPDLPVLCIVSITRLMAERASARPPGADSRRPSPPPPLARVVLCLGSFPLSCDISLAYVHTSTFIHSWHRTDWCPADGEATVAV